MSGVMVPDMPEDEQPPVAKPAVPAETHIIRLEGETTKRTVAVVVAADGHQGNTFKLVTQLAAVLSEVPEFSEYPVHIIPAPKGTLETVTEFTMNQLGWHRAPDIADLETEAREALNDFCPLTGERMTGYKQYPNAIWAEDGSVYRFTSLVEQHDIDEYGEPEDEEG